MRKRYRYSWGRLQSLKGVPIILVLSLAWFWWWSSAATALGIVGMLSVGLFCLSMPVVVARMRSPWEIEVDEADGALIVHDRTGDHTLRISDVHVQGFRAMFVGEGFYIIAEQRQFRVFKDICGYEQLKKTMDNCSTPPN